MTSAEERGGLESGRDAAVFVWGAWALSTAVAFGFAAQFSRDIAWWDDQVFLPLLTGDEPFSIGRLFDPHKGHVMPIPNAVWLACHSLAGGDFRAAAFVNVAILAAVAAGLVGVARCLRGHRVYADAVLPLATLQAGQAWTFLWGFQLQFVCSLALVFAFLARAILSPVPTTRGDAALRAFLLVALPLCGGNGAVAAIPLAAWALYAAWRSRRESGATAAILGTGALAALALVVSLAVAVPGEGPAAGARPALVAALQAVGLTFGSPGRFGWFRRESLVAWPPPAISFAAAALVVATLALLVSAARRDAAVRPRATALAAGIASVLAVALAIGVRRAGLDSLAGTWSRYVTLMLPLAWCAHFAWDAYGSPAARRFVQHTLLAAFCAASAAGAIDTWNTGQTWRSLTQTIETEARAGVDPTEMARRHTEAGGVRPEEARALLDGQRRARLGPYRATAK
jgi:hypothetical protein